MTEMSPEVLGARAPLSSSSAPHLMGPVFILRLRPVRVPSRHLVLIPNPRPQAPQARPRPLVFPPYTLSYLFPTLLVVPSPSPPYRPTHLLAFPDYFRLSDVVETPLPFVILFALSYLSVGVVV